MPLIPALRRLNQVDLWGMPARSILQVPGQISGQPDSQTYIETYLKKKKKKPKKTKPKKQKQTNQPKKPLKKNLINNLKLISLLLLTMDYPESTRVKHILSSFKMKIK